jgi:tRNA dimethylallyltransferase
MTTDASPTTRVLAVVGPTAVGKTALAEELAVRLSGEIVSADSMQIYRGMDIGTAKPAPDERRVAYHCLDLADPGEPFSAALFQRAAREAIAGVASRGSLPVVAGGTGLYVRAALDRMEFPKGEQADNPRREAYEAFAAENGPDALHELLAQRDPDSAAAVHPNNTRRVIRALEMADEGVSYAEQAAGFSARESVYDVCMIGLTMEREALYARIDARVDAMISAGLLGEVERLLEAGLREALTASQAIGYKEFVPVIEDGADLGEAIDAVKQASRRYAKRQLTWFRSDPRIAWIDVGELTGAQAADAAADRLDWSAPPVGKTTGTT